MTPEREPITDAGRALSRDERGAIHREMVFWIGHQWHNEGGIASEYVRDNLVAYSDAVAIEARARGAREERERWLDVARQVVYYADITADTVRAGEDLRSVSDAWGKTVAMCREALGEPEPVNPLTALAMDFAKHPYPHDWPPLHRYRARRRDVIGSPCVDCGGNAMDRAHRDPEEARP